MTDAQDVKTAGISLRGFSKESIEAIREMESFGWVFRLSNHGVVGHAPNDKTTISISRNLNKTNRSLYRVRAEFKRWLKVAHPEVTDVVATYTAERDEADKLAESSPIIAGILENRAIARTMGKIDAIVDPIARVRLARQAQDEETAQPAQTDSEEVPVAAPSVTKIEPFHAKKSKDGLARVMQRTWSTGRVDFTCAYPACTVTSRNARSVSQHYGAVHTRPIQSYAHVSTDEVAALAPVEPAEGLPWEALAETVEELRESEPAPVVNLDPPEEHPITKQMIDEQYTREVVATGEMLMPDAVKMVMTIQGIVNRPLLEEMKRLADQVTGLQDEVSVMTKERDEAVEHLAKIQQDLTALRQLIASIGAEV